VSSDECSNKEVKLTPPLRGCAGRRLRRRPLSLALGVKEHGSNERQGCKAVLSGNRASGMVGITYPAARNHLQFVALVLRNELRQVPAFDNWLGSNAKSPRSNLGMETKKPFIPRDKPKSWVIFIICCLSGILVGGPLAFVGAWSETAFVKGIGFALFAISWGVGMMAWLVFALGLVRGKYRNIKEADWNEQVW